MKKPKDITVIMPNPCKKRDWDDMTPNASGRHCSNCDFTVIDFTNYTDKELVDFLLKSKGKLCGMFENYQLNRPMTIAPEKTNTLLNRALLSAALLAGVATSANGQTSTPTHTPVQNNISQDKKEKKENTHSELSIPGIIIDKKTKEPIAHAGISIKDQGIYTETDSNGRFDLPIPDSLSKKKITIIVYCSLYKRRTFTFIPFEMPDADFKVVLKQEKGWKRHVVMGCPSF